MRGGIELARGRGTEAAVAFDAVVAELPGESAPKYALALALEAAGNHAAALGLHQLLALADFGAVGAAFGWARCALAQGDAAAVATALASVPAGSPLHTRAQVALARALLDDKTAATSVGVRLERASAVLEGLELEGELRHRIAVEVHQSALGGLLARAVPAAAEILVLGCPLEERRLRLAIEHSLRALAHLSAEPREKIRLVDLANSLRPASLF